jgi:hypothetical protein
MHRGYKLYLEDILASIDKIQSYIGSFSLEDFAKDEMRVDAVVRNFEIIGEASRNIPILNGEKLLISEMFSPMNILVLIMKFCGTLSRISCQISNRKLVLSSQINKIAKWGQVLLTTVTSDGKKKRHKA